MTKTPFTEHFSRGQTSPRPTDQSPNIQSENTTDRPIHLPQSDPQTPHFHGLQGGSNPSHHGPVPEPPRLEYTFFKIFYFRSTDLQFFSNCSESLETLLRHIHSHLLTIPLLNLVKVYDFLFSFSCRVCAENSPIGFKLCLDYRNSPPNYFPLEFRYFCENFVHYTQGG